MNDERQGTASSAQGPLAQGIATSEAAGLLFVLTFVLLSAAKHVYAASLLQEINVFLFLLVCFAVAALAFNLIDHLIPVKTSVALDPLSRRDLVFLNGTTAFNWFWLFVALQYMEPAIVNAVIVGSGPLVVLFMDSWLRSYRQISWGVLGATTGVLGSATFLVWSSLEGHSAVESSYFDLAIGVFATILAALPATGNIVYSKRLSDRGWRPTRIMAHRFYLIVVMAAIGVLISPVISPVKAPDTPDLWIGIIGVAILGVTLPLLLLQLGIRCCEPFVIRTITSLTPIFVFMFQWFDDRLSLSLYTLVGVVSLVAFNGLSVYLRRT